MRESFYSVAGCPCKIALASDLHEKPWGAVLASLKRNRPALICVPGDFLFGRLPKEDLKIREAGVLPFFASCCEIAPCFVSLGNHEWLLTEEDAALLRGTGAVLLDNACTMAEIAGRRLVIGGLTSARVNEYRRALATGLSVLEANELTHPRRRQKRMCRRRFRGWTASALSRGIIFCSATTRSIIRAGCGSAPSTSSSAVTPTAGRCAFSGRVSTPPGRACCRSSRAA